MRAEPGGEEITQSRAGSRRDRPRCGAKGKRVLEAKPH